MPYGHSDRRSVLEVGHGSMNWVRGPSIKTDAAQTVNEVRCQTGPDVEEELWAVAKSEREAKYYYRYLDGEMAQNCSRVLAEILKGGKV